MKIVLGIFLSLGLLYAAPKKLVLGVENLNYYPYYDFTRESHDSFTRELFMAFGKESDYEIIFEALPLKRLLMSLIVGEVDLKFPDNRHWSQSVKQAVNVIYSDPVVPYTDGTMVMKLNKGNTDIKILGTVMGFTPWEYLEEIEKGNVSVLENAGFINLLKQTILNRVDGAYVNVDVAKHYLRDKLEMPEALVFDDTLPYTSDFYHLSTIKYPSAIEQFNFFMKKNQSYIQSLMKKYKIKSHNHKP